MAHALELDSFVKTEIIPSSPFSFSGTFHKPSHYPTPDKKYSSEIYWQTGYFRGQNYGLKFVNQGSTDSPKVGLSVYFNSSLGSSPDIIPLVEELKYRFDLQCELNIFTDSFAADPLLGPVIERWRGMRVSTAYSFYEFTVVTTLLQNTVVHRTVQMMENLFHHYGTLLQFDGHRLSSFWSPDTIDHEDESKLRALKLGYRAKTLKRQAADFVSGKIDIEEFRGLDNKLLKKNLLQMYGIGPATVQYAMFEMFHRYDALEHIPPWEQKIYSRLFFDQALVDTSVLLAEIERRYGRWKMLAVHYIFEDLFWRRQHEHLPWLEELIRL